MSPLADRNVRPNISDLGPIPRDEEGPVFNAPWEATAFAMAVKLCEAGHFTWNEWVASFSKEIKSFEEKGIYDPASDDARHYYEIWLSTLEKMISQKGMFDKDTLDARHQYLIDNPVPHDHVARREPICVA